MLLQTQLRIEAWPRFTGPPFAIQLSRDCGISLQRRAIDRTSTTLKIVRKDGRTSVTGL